VVLNSRLLQTGGSGGLPISVELHQLWAFFFWPFDGYAVDSDLLIEVNVDQQLLVYKLQQQSNGGTGSSGKFSTKDICLAGNLAGNNAATICHNWQLF